MQRLLARWCEYLILAGTTQSSFTYPSVSAIHYQNDFSSNRPNMLRTYSRITTLLAISVAYPTISFVFRFLSPRCWTADFVSKLAVSNAPGISEFSPTESFPLFRISWRTSSTSDPYKCFLESRWPKLHSQKRDNNQNNISIKIAAMLSFWITPRILL